MATHNHKRFFLAAVMLAAPGIVPALLADSIYNVTINTSGISSQNGELVFDFTSGGGPSSNIVSISEFTSDGLLGATSNTGLITGTLPGVVMLKDDPTNSVFNEYLTGFTFGSSISFQLDATTNGPGASSSPDEFAAFFLDSSGINSLISSSDPTGADSLLLLDIDGTPGGSPAVFSVSSPANVSATVMAPASTVPEPSSLELLIAMVVCWTSVRRWAVVIALLPARTSAAQNAEFEAPLRPRS